MSSAIHDRKNGWLRVARWATYVLVLLMPLSVFWPLGEPAAPGVLPLYVSRGIYLSDLPLAFALTAVLAGGLIRRGGRLPLLLPLFGLAGLGLLTAVFATHPAFALYTAVRWLLAAVFALWIAQEVLDREKLVAVFVAGLAVQALIGLGQTLAQRPLGLPGELALPPELSGAAIVEAAGGRWLRAYGLTFHPNVLGGFLALGLVLLIPLLGRRRIWPLWWLLWLGLFVSFSRAAWLAAALIAPPLLLWLAWRRPKMRRPFLAAGLGAGAVLLVCSAVWWQQLATRLGPLAPAAVVPTAEPAPFEQYSLQERGDLTAVALAMIRERPWTGVGAGGFPLAVIIRGDLVRPQAVHNVPLLLASEVGLAGGALWLLAGLAGVIILLRHRRTATPWPIVALGGWLVICVLSLFDSYPWGLNAGRLLTAFALGLAAKEL